MGTSIWKSEKRLLVVDADQIETLIKNNPGHMTRDIAEISAWESRDLTEKKKKKIK